LVKRVALVTGCAKADGIGAAAARALAAAGLIVMINGRSASSVSEASEEGSPGRTKWEGLKSLEAEIVANGGEACMAIGDVGAEADVRRMVAETLDRYGRIDVVVNNASAPHGLDRNDIEAVPLSAWEEVMGTNARGVFLMTREVAKPMRKQRWGRIINISSSSSHRPVSKMAVYSASKGAINSFTKSVAMDLAPWGITVNAICAGQILTSRAYSTARRVGGAKDVEAVIAERAQNIPLGRHGRPDEVAATIVFLASDGASYITAQTINVDGGSAGSIQVQATLREAARKQLENAN
jgi:3-oxoacyl-[acyl-carrier protein] reductase